MERSVIVTRRPKFEGMVDGFRVEAVKKKLCNLKPDKSPVPGGIHPMFLRECANDAAEPLSILFSKAFISGEIPLPVTDSFTYLFLALKF